MIRSVIAATVLLGGITILLAQSDPIAERQTLMKSNAKNAKNVTQMVKGETPFDAAHRFRCPSAIALRPAALILRLPRRGASEGTTGALGP